MDAERAEPQTRVVQATAKVLLYVRTCRKKWALSQSDVARLLGFKGDARSKIHAFERGVREPSFKKLLALEVIFGMSAGEIFPRAYEDVEAAVMARAGKLYEKLEHAADAKSRRKVALLRNMMRRAKPTSA